MRPMSLATVTRQRLRYDCAAAVFEPMGSPRRRAIRPRNGRSSWTFVLCAWAFGSLDSYRVLLGPVIGRLWLPAHIGLFDRGESGAGRKGISVAAREADISSLHCFDFLGVCREYDPSRAPTGIDLFYGARDAANNPRSYSRRWRAALEPGCGMVELYSGAAISHPSGNRRVASGCYFLLPLHSPDAGRTGFHSARNNVRATLVALADRLSILSIPSKLLRIRAAVLSVDSGARPQPQ